MNEQKIKILPNDLINQIAAGEIIERPTSVIRELVDNSIDAKASHIQIYIQDGGKKLIEVKDNGQGMTKEDAKLCIERHATSKISSQEDLNTISSLGFRGEAIPSIASVSRMSIKTKTALANVAYKFVLDNGKITSENFTSASNGTEISIVDLFYNTPARRKFLSSSEVEVKFLTRWLKNYALSHYAVRFQLFVDNKEKLNIPATHSFVERAKNIFSGNFVEYKHSQGPLEINLYLSHPGEFGSSNKDFVIIVNSRVVSDRAIFRAVKDAYGSMLKHFESPRGVINLTINPAFVDVNVHPQKSEVRFRNSRDIFVEVKKAAENSLKKLTGHTLVTNYSNAENISNTNTSYFNIPTENINVLINKPAFTNEKIVFNTEFSTEVNADNSTFNCHELTLENKIEITSNNTFYNLDNDSKNYQSSNFKFANLTYHAQVLGCFFICSWENRLIIIDMHAAHERIQFNKIRQNFNSTILIPQMLLFPEIIALDSVLMERVENYLQLFLDCGFEVEVFSENSIIVRAAPSLLGDTSIKNLILELLSSEAEQEFLAGIDRKLDYIASRIACHSSYRSGDYMNPDEVKIFFTNLDVAVCGAACPHGRPILKDFSKQAVESWFGRDK